MTPTFRERLAFNVRRHRSTLDDLTRSALVVAAPYGVTEFSSTGVDAFHARLIEAMNDLSQKEQDPFASWRFHFEPGSWAERQYAAIFRDYRKFVDAREEVERLERRIAYLEAKLAA